MSEELWTRDDVEDQLVEGEWRTTQEICQALQVGRSGSRFRNFVTGTLFDLERRGVAERRAASRKTQDADLAWRLRESADAPASSPAVRNDDRNET